MHADASEIFERKRIALTSAGGVRGNQPFHFVEKLEIREAERYLEAYAMESEQLARTAIRQTMQWGHRSGMAIECCGLLLASGRPLPPLPQILASHALIHAAEGEFFRDMVRRACSLLKIPVHGYRQRELGALAKASFGSAASRMERQIGALGRQLGPPWTLDQKAATMAACLALAARGQHSKA